MPDIIDEMTAATDEKRGTKVFFPPWKLVSVKKAWLIVQDTVGNQKAIRKTQAAEYGVENSKREG